MSSSPQTVLQHLVEATLELTGCDSAGISLLEPGGEHGTFRWVATAGAWAPYRDGTMPREESPCGEVVAREAVLLVSEPQRAFPALLQAEPGIGEGLLAPFTVEGVPTGTVWAIKHGLDGRFEAEDARLLKRLARFASLAHQMVLALNSAQASGQESEARYRSLFETMGQGYALVELVRDVSGKAVDQRYIEFNPAIERLLGVPAADAAGKLASEVFPGIEPWWTATFDRVVREGRPERIEHFFEPLGRWFEVYAYPAGEDRFTTLYEDVTERRAAEAVLRENERRQAFLLSLTDAIRSEPSERAIVERALLMLAEELAVDRCYATRLYPAEDLTEVIHEVRSSGLAPMPLRFRNSDFPEAFQQTFDRTLVFADTANDPTLADTDKSALATMGFVAFLSRPLRRDGIPIFSVGAASSCPRRWTPGEIALVEEVTERTWAAIERSQAELALRKSESRLRALFDSVDHGFMEVEVKMSPEGRAVDWRYVALNPSFYRLTGMEDVTGRLASEVFPDREPEWAERYAQVVTTGEPMRFELPAAAIGRWFDINLVNVGGAGSRRIAVVYDDVTERKRAEAVLRENEARQAFLLRLSDALRAEPSAEAIAHRALGMLFEQMRLDRCYVGVYRLEEDIAEFPQQVHGRHLPPLPDQVRLSDFPEALRIAFDRTMVIDDAAEMESFSDSDRASFNALSLRAAIAATLRKGENNPLWAIVAGSSCPRIWTKGEVSLVEEVAERTWAAIERARTEMALGDSEARFRQFSDASTNVLWIRDAATARMEFASPAFDTIYGIPGPNRGGDPGLRAWVRLIEPESRKTVLTNFRRLRAGERAEMEFRIRRASDGALRWIHCSDFPLRDSAGKVRWVAGLGSDITDHKEATDRQHVLVAELQHRTRNLMAVIRSMSDKTGRTSADLPDFRARFRTRLDAMARVQGLLSRLGEHDRVTFDQLLDAELAALSGSADRVSVEGPKGIRLRSSMVQTLAMAIHELATNAVKYGALKPSNGHLAITYDLDSTDPVQPRLFIDWRESGVAMPSLQPHPGGGQGRELIERALPYQLSAETTYELGPDGVHCTISVPAVSTAAGVPDVEHA